MVIVICLAGMLVGGGAAAAGVLLFDPGLLGMLLAYFLCGSLGSGLAAVGLALGGKVGSSRPVPSRREISVPSP